VAQLRRKEKEFGDLGVRVVLVGLGSPEATAGFKADFDVPFAMIADANKTLFKAFELKQATSKSLLSMGMVRKGFSAMFKGHGMGIPSGDVRQLPGVFIIDTDGQVRFSHYARDPADHPKAEELLAHVEKGLKSAVPAG